MFCSTPPAEPSTLLSLPDELIEQILELAEPHSEVEEVEQWKKVTKTYVATLLVNKRLHSLSFPFAYRQIVYDYYYDNPFTCIFENRQLFAPWVRHITAKVTEGSTFWAIALPHFTELTSITFFGDEGYLPVPVVKVLKELPKVTRLGISGWNQCDRFGPVLLQEWIPNLKTLELNDCGDFITKELDLTGCTNLERLVGYPVISFEILPIVVSLLPNLKFVTEFQDDTTHAGVLDGAIAQLQAKYTVQVSIHSLSSSHRSRTDIRLPLRRTRAPSLSSTSAPPSPRPSSPNHPNLLSILSFPSTNTLPISDPSNSPRSRLSPSEPASPLLPFPMW